MPRAFLFRPCGGLRDVSSKIGAVRRRDATRTSPIKQEPGFHPSLRNRTVWSTGLDSVPRPSASGDSGTHATRAHPRNHSSPAGSVWKVAVSGVRNVNSTWLTGRNEPDGDGVRLDCSFVSNYVDCAASMVNKRHPRGVDMRRTGGIICLILRDRSRRYENQGVTRMGVPPGGSSRRPNVAEDGAV